MGKILQFALNLKDGMSPVLKKIKSNGTSTFNTLTKKSKEYANSIERTTSKIKKSDNSLKNMVSTAKKLAVVIGGGKLLGGFIKEFVNLEQAQIAFTTFFGDEKIADGLMNTLVEFANVTKYTTQDVIASGRSLAAFGVSASQIKPSLKVLGDLAAGTGKNLQDMTLIYGKTKALGRVYAFQLNQLARNGIPVIAEFAKHFGVAKSEIRKMATEGKIQFSDLQQIMINMTSEGGIFNDMMAKQAKTLGGRWSTLVGKFQIFGAYFVDNFLKPMLKGLVEIGIKIVDAKDWIYGAFKTILEILRPVYDKFLEIFDAIKSFLPEGQSFASVFEEFVLPALQRFVDLIITTIDFIISVVKFLWDYKNVIAILGAGVLVYIAISKAWAAINWVLALSFAAINWQIVGIALIVMGLAAIFVMAWNKFAIFRNVLMTGFKSIGTAFEFVVDVAKNAFKILKSVYFDPFIDIMFFIGRIVKDVLTFNWSDVDDAWDDFSNNMVGNVTDAIDGAVAIKDAFVTAGKEVSKTWKDVTTNSDSYKIKIPTVKGFKEMIGLGGPIEVKPYVGKTKSKGTNDKELKVDKDTVPGGGTGKGGLVGAASVSKGIKRPAIVNIDFHPMLNIEYDVANGTESREELRKEFELFLIDIANLSGQGWR